MVTTTRVDDSHPSLAELLSARAKASPVSRLVIDLVGGAAVAGMAVWARQFGWFPLLAAGVCLSAYGLWALIERRLESERDLSERAALTLELALRGAATVGLVGFVGLLFGLLAIAFGPVIS